MRSIVFSAITRGNALNWSIRKHIVCTHGDIQYVFGSLNLLIKTYLAIKGINWEMEPPILFSSRRFLTESLDNWLFLNNLINAAVRRDFKTCQMPYSFWNRGIIQNFRLVLVCIPCCVLHYRDGRFQGILFLLSFLVGRDFLMMSKVKFGEKLLHANFILL